MIALQRREGRGSAALRPAIAFRRVNRRGCPGYQPGMQRHHLLPAQLLGKRCFRRLFDRLGRERVGFDDFRRNGLLLPATEHDAIRSRLPLHRGPHGSYNELVIERVGQIEGDWARGRACAPDDALELAAMRLALLQGALRRRLLTGPGRVRLNRRDPLGTDRDFTALDTLVESLWQASDVVGAPASRLAST